MMLAKRVIACLDVKQGRVVKGTEFVQLRDIGDPAVMAANYEHQGADEIVFLDIAAGPDGRATTLDVVRDAAQHLFVPLTVGGGIRSVDDFAAVLSAGADKVAVNSAAIRDPSVLTNAATRFGSQCVVSSIDVRGDVVRGWTVYADGGRSPTGLDAVAWARECAERGAGEILVTSIDRDGRRSGYDVELTAAVADAVSVPVVASGGAASPTDVCTVLRQTGAAAALIAGSLHDGDTSVFAIKKEMRAAGIPVRWSL
jgi:cyclase